MTASKAGRVLQEAAAAKYIRYAAMPYRYLFTGVHALKHRRLYQPAQRLRVSVFQGRRENCATVT
jgi:hypothetical protein